MVKNRNDVTKKEGRTYKENELEVLREDRDR
jgi:hypothetical protein